MATAEKAPKAATATKAAPPTVSPEEIAARLAAPFAADQVRRKPQVVQGTQALAIHYIDARLVAQRLDEVLGIFGWRDAYEERPDGTVLCRLSIRHGKTWHTKEGLGKSSKQPDPGDRRKAAYSDALKIAAVKWGIGRYLYRLPQEWLPYDTARRCFVGEEPIRAKKGKAPANGRTQAPPTPTPVPVSQPAPQAPPPAVPAPTTNGTVPISAKQIAEIVRLRGVLQVPDAAWTGVILAKRGVTSAREMTEAQAAELIGALQHQCVVAQLQQSLNAHQVQGGLAADGLAAPDREPDFRRAPEGGAA